MLVRSPELYDRALEVANSYNPLLPPRLCGSVHWCGKGKDVDVVLLAATYPDILADALDTYPGCDFRSYRHGAVNVIVTTSAQVWAGWVYACDNIGVCPADKQSRVAHVENLRARGELLYAEAASQ